MDRNEFQIKKLGISEVSSFQKLIRLFAEVFEMEKQSEAGESYLTSLLAKPDFIAYCIIFENEVVGGLTAYELGMYYSENTEIFIYDIAVKPEFQRMGFGKKLLLSLEKYGRQNGTRTIFVAANEEDEHALDFYHSTGGNAEKVVHFNYSLDSQAANGGEAEKS